MNGDRRQAPRRLADILALLEAAGSGQSSALSAAVAKALAERGLEVEPAVDLAALRLAVARALAASARAPDRRLGGRRAEDRVREVDR